jgi:hypothetical protein
MAALIGFLSGMGEAGVKLGTQHMKYLEESDLLKERAEIDAMKEARLIALKAKVEDQTREASVARVDQAAGRIADTAVAGKRALIGEGVVDKENWTSEQQAAVEQSLAADKAALIGDPRTRERAAISTGDISPEKAATIDRDERRLAESARATDSKERQAEKRDETQRYIAEMREATAQKRIEALIARTGAGKDGTREALAFLDGVRKDLASEAANLKAMYQADIKDVSSSKREAIKKEYEPKFADIEAKRKKIEQDFDALREKVGLPKAAAPAPEKKPEAAKPAAISSLPAGAKKIGTSGGKTVYQTPDGKKYIED